MYFWSGWILSVISDRNVELLSPWKDDTLWTDTRTSGTVTTEIIWIPIRADRVSQTLFTVCSCFFFTSKRSHRVSAAQTINGDSNMSVFACMSVKFVFFSPLLDNSKKLFLQISRTGNATLLYSTTAQGVRGHFLLKTAVCGEKQGVFPACVPESILPLYQTLWHIAFKLCYLQLWLLTQRGDSFLSVQDGGIWHDDRWSCRAADKTVWISVSDNWGCVPGFYSNNDILLRVFLDSVNSLMLDPGIPGPERRGKETKQGSGLGSAIK